MIHLWFRIPDHRLEPGDEIGGGPEEPVSRSVVDEDKVGVVPVQRNVVALLYLDVGVVPMEVEMELISKNESIHLKHSRDVVELVEVVVDKDVEVLDVAVGDETEQFEATAHLVTILSMITK